MQGMQSEGKKTSSREDLPMETTNIGEIISADIVVIKSTAVPVIILG